MKTFHSDDREDPFDRAERALQLAIDELREAAGDEAPVARDAPGPRPQETRAPEPRPQKNEPVEEAAAASPQPVQKRPVEEPLPVRGARVVDQASDFMWAAEPSAEFSAPAELAERPTPAPAGLHVASVSDIAIPASELVALRLDLDVIAHYQASGSGWQGRVNAALREAAGL